MIKEHDVVVLTEDLPQDELKAGDVGTIVHIHQNGLAFQVEFVTLSGRTVAVATARAAQVRPVSPRDLVHVRELQTA
ncbi:MAG: DUF4926 domain-containing protein [Planctomycetota bacterium]|nr:DUF4926 domain-containing protein [Planctomycetota bacterium]